MTVFETLGPSNTVQTAEIAAKKAAELGCDLVVSSNEGPSADALYNACKKFGATGKIIVVSHVSGFRAGGQNELSDAKRKELIDKGMIVVTAGHALSGVERTFSSKFGGVYPVEIIAHTLRTFGQGTKVCFECSAMALDAGVIDYAKPVVAVGGTGRGADTAIVLTPSYSSSIFDTEMHEMLCKPYYPKPKKA